MSGFYLILLFAYQIINDNRNKLKTPEERNKQKQVAINWRFFYACFTQSELTLHRKVNSVGIQTTTLKNMIHSSMSFTKTSQR